MSTTSRVLVVDDSAFMRQIICDLIEADSHFTVIATANNGREAIDAVRLHKPDIITMDLEMPEMNGLDALERIMRIHPVPIIMMSSISDDGTRETIKALQSGAFDFIRKPSGPLSPDIRQVGEQLLEKLRIAVLTKRYSRLYEADHPAGEAPDKAKPVATSDTQKPATDRSTAGKQLPNERAADKQPAAGKQMPDKQTPDKKAFDRLTADKRSSASGLFGRKAKAATAAAPAEQRGKPLDEPSAGPAAPSREAAQQIEAAKLQAAPSFDPEPSRPPKQNAKPAQAFQHLVAIGTSTGGPRALHEVITALPEDFPAPVLVVQHMPPKFTRSLAQRLDTFSSVRVTEAEHGERVYAGVVYIAPGGYHLELAKDSGGYCIKLSDEAPRSGHRPSVDMLFESCAAFPELRRHAVIMTGMGNDGVKGMKKLNESGAVTAIAESEETCVVYGMPRSAVEAGAAKTVLPLKGIAPALTAAVRK
ncbi:chemotaxis response regulator protein-glutamate methylesterase [Paenibacillus lycopersici]|uniref:Protein-glutamate methylesterase/protein-glutamine glutaminase n=1 Tax=Paenibacillus lycopersici TaxID=2704462 RepID=A0A6C0G604_9BACL|nr:chemotaxis response regulator protein-glutamate methylesterase [Paenibacillus lycopersici]QHT60715.1 chemotaxis response regulator protein-glutamate methylesterase [Paenibacillus lycopersici]